MRAEWRTEGRTDVILLVEEADRVVDVAPAPDTKGLRSFLAAAATLESWRDSLNWETAVSAELDSYGELVLSRGERGEVLFVDPGLFWEGVYRHFRSRGIDYT